MERKLTFTFGFNIDGRAYNFNVIADDEKAALEMLKQDLISLISEINVE